MKWAFGVANATAATLVAALVLWLLHPKGADTPLPQGLPAAIPGTGPVTWVVLGSSLSTGDWPQVSADLLQACSGRAVKVVQITGPGRGSDWGAAQIAPVLAARPDLITVEFTINDADMRRGILPADSIANHLAILRALPANTSAVLLRLNRAHGLRAALRPLQARYDAQLVTIATQTGAGLIDLRPKWSTADPRDRPDGLHPTDAAAIARTAPALAHALAPLLSATAECPAR